MTYRQYYLLVVVTDWITANIIVYAVVQRNDNIIIMYSYTRGI